MNKTKQNKYATIDVGGTNTRFALFNELGQIILKEKTQTDYLDAHKTSQWIKDQILKHNIEYLALCIPGPSDYKNGIILKSPNLGGSWVNFDLKSFLLDKTKIKHIIFENDANAMALANHKNFKQSKDSISQFFTISTGFGAGLIINDQIYHGNNYYAQEIAQIPLSKSGFDGEHRLKNQYALELHCSGSGIETKAKFLKVANNAKEVFEKANLGDLKAQEIVKQAQEALTNVFATSAGILAPHNFFIGGSLGLAQKEFVKQAFEKAKEISDFNHFNNIHLYFDNLGDDSALIGLYYLAKEH
ncbi:ROK family protein [Mycoplasma leonicaptivi]|uniref:ROK family protein n=1 Tax=Mycoplasma leonicaptivi TaxID=36742 RepID=UPI0004856BE4|nr:ROK family protein [Mycoplasma leonicaptivi]